ncbi:MAG: hypothetical protein ACRENG_10900 [bacterium]
MEETTVGKELIRIGIRRVILMQIAQRFGAVPDAVRRQIEKIDNVKHLERIARELLKVKDLGQFKGLIGLNGKPSPLNGSGLNGKRKKDI